METVKTEGGGQEEVCDPNAYAVRYSQSVIKTNHTLLKLNCKHPMSQ